MAYAPDRGDLVWLDFDPQAGREHAKRRPALVLSPAKYNRKAGLMLACPITSKLKPYPFHVELPAGLPVSGVVIADQIKSLDWQARHADFIGVLDTATLDEVLARLQSLLFE
jgi:mRNA interferase MazF